MIIMVMYIFCVASYIVYDCMMLQGNDCNIQTLKIKKHMYVYSMLTQSFVANDERTNECTNQIEGMSVINVAHFAA